MKLKDKSGMRFGRLLVLNSHKSVNKRTKWLCKCDCGKEVWVDTQNLKPDGTKSCGCWRKENAKKLNSIEYGLSAKKMVYKDYQQGASKRNLYFKLSFNNFIELATSDCYYCGAKPSNLRKSKANNGNFIYNGIDRIDNDLGYIDDNVVPCCRECNSAKRNRTLGDFLTWVKNIYERHI